MIIPKKIGVGGHIRVIAPARSLSLLSEEIKNEAIERLEGFSFKVSFGKNTAEIDEFNSSSIESRVSDLHEAFLDKDVDAILTTIGGYNVNQLLDYIDYEIIKNNPKIICGFSDITALSNAIWSKTGLITYSGPHFSSWAMKKGFEYSIDQFVACCMNKEPFELIASDKWSDDPWYINQEKRDFIDNSGFWVLNKGEAEGVIVGGHARCLNALQGTKYWPSLNNSILFLEDDEETNPPLFDRALQSLIQQTDFGGVKAVVIGKFQKGSKMNIELLKKIISTKKELKNIPVVANVDFGHTTPIITFPVGGTCKIVANDNGCKINIINH